MTVKEFCEKCGTQIQVGEEYEEDTMKMRHISRVEIHFNESSHPLAAGQFGETLVLCPECAKLWHYEE